MIFFSSRSFAPKESTILHTKVYPTRVGVSRLYVTFISDDVCSLTQTIPLEITLESIKKQDEPLLKTNTEISTKVDEKSEIKNEEKEVISSKNISDNQDKLPIKEEEQKSLPKIEEKYQDKKFDDEHEDEDDLDEPYLKKQQNHLHSNTAANSSAPHGSTLSLDKDKMSVDSLDIPNGRRYSSNNNQ
jgi:hypothetical protein